MTRPSAVTPTEHNERYERLRRRALGGGPGRQDGLAMLRQHGLHAWIAQVGAAPPAPEPEPSATAALTPGPVTSPRSPLLCLCTDMLLATLTHQEAP